MTFIIRATLLLLAATAAIAGETSLSWTTPTQNEECVNAGPITDFVGIDVWQRVARIDDPTATGFVVSGMEPGSYTYTVSSFTGSGIESRLSGSVTKEVTEFVVTNIVVKIVLQTPGKILLLGVGTVPLGTACDITTEANDHFAVPLDDVVWSDPARNDGTAPLPILVVAQCG